MKKYSMMAILNRMPNFDFTIKAKEPDDDTLTTICTSDQFRTKLRQKYWSFQFLTGDYNDPDYGNVELATDINDAVTMFIEAFNVWRDDRKIGFLKLLNALRSKYDPIWNVDGTETETIIRDLDTTNLGQKQNTGTQTVKNTGTETTKDTGTQTTADTGTESKANTGTSATAKTGTEGVQGSGNTTTQNSPYDDNLFYNKEKSDTTNNETTTFNTTDTITDNLNEQKTRNLQNQRTDNLTSTRTDDLTNLRTDNLNENTTGSGTEDETTTRTLKKQGNIGVTKTQDLLLSQFEITEFDALIDYIVNLFVHENLVQ